MEMSEKREFDFPVGYRDFHKKQLFNFQLNRWYSLGYARFEDMEEAGRRIHDFDDWKAVMVELAERAFADGRMMNAAFHYRAAEFYTFQDDPDKESLYDRFIERFYTVFRDDPIERFEVPYEEGALPAMKVRADGDAKKGTIVMHGGFDSFIEEFYSWMRFFAGHGYDVIAFEGPGQGAARRKHGLALDSKWEKPAKAILDHFGLDDVTWLGISMGGYFCFRAAAFESRIKRVIASGIAYDYWQFSPKWAQWIGHIFFTYFKGFTNWITIRKMDKDGMHKWALSNFMYIAKKEQPMDIIDSFQGLNAENLHSELVKQDVLILTGKEDHFIPLKMHAMQVNALINARSVTGRIFTKKEQAHNHCQIGNIGLALDVMVNWIGQKENENTDSAFQR